jgi:hypothetical protein
MNQLLGRDSKKGFFCRNQNQLKSRTSARIREGRKEVGEE